MKVFFILAYKATSHSIFLFRKSNNYNSKTGCQKTGCSSTYYKSCYFSCMKAASISELKIELLNTPAEELVELCLRLSKFKKENKELLTYLLFESFDEAAYVANIKAEMQLQFEEINTSSLYFVKKSLRKILRTLNKYIRYTGSVETEVSLLLSFCFTLKASGIPFEKNLVIKNMYQNQLKKIAKAIATMHEDLQFEYIRSLETLS